MSLKHALLTLLSSEPCYGNQMRAELAARTGGLWVVNPGQVYATLERCVRDGEARRLSSGSGLSEAARPAEGRPGRVRYEATARGREAALAWLVGPSADAQEVVLKVVLATELPGLPGLRVARAQLELLDGAAPAPGLYAEGLWRISSALGGWLAEVASSLESGAGVAERPISHALPRRGRPVHG